MNKKLNLPPITFKKKSIFNRICSWIVRTIINKGWAGETVLSGKFIELWTKRKGRSILVSASKKKLLGAINKERSIIKKHFIGGPSYPLDLSYIKDSIINDYFGFLVSDIITAHLVKNLPVDMVLRIGGSSVLVKRKK